MVSVEGKHLQNAGRRNDESRVYEKHQSFAGNGGGANLDSVSCQVTEIGEFKMIVMTICRFPRHKLLAFI